MSSVFLWDLDDGGFAGVVLLKKSAFFAFKRRGSPEPLGSTQH